MAYIDTSVLVAYYCPEPLSKTAQEALESLEHPVISPLVELELNAALAAKVRAGEMDETTARRIVVLLQEHLDDGCYTVVPIAVAEYGLARDWIARFSCPLHAPDALHLAAAFHNDLILLTADRALARSAQHLKLKHKLISG
jgi:predicted nucleic acid-binding protein